ncbi:MAG: hypothetical protein ABSA03_15060 [Streptosporangiaceae bacterium]|jgi:hypothetical protein
MPVQLGPGPGLAVIKPPRYHRESQLIGIDLVDDPAPGLEVKVTHWSVPRGKILDIFIPAHGTGHETGVLDPEPWADQYLVPEPEPDFSALPTVYIHEELSTRGFYRRWSERANGHLYVSLYDEEWRRDA